VQVIAPEEIPPNRLVDRIDHLERIRHAREHMPRQA
jgi:hypothetical protein